MPKPKNALKLFLVQRPLYEDFTRKLEILLIELLRLKKINYQLIESRAKSIESLQKKLSGPGKSYDNPLDIIPDLSGIRIIVYYNDDIDRVNHIINEEFDVVEIERSHQPEVYEVDKFGYISIHFVVRLSEERKKLTEWTSYKDLHSEIQVRTVLQHSWAAISHALQYKREADVPLKSQRRLFRLAGLLELADEEFAVLRNEQKESKSEAKKSLKDKGKIVDLDSATVLEYLNSWDNFPSIINKIKKYGYKLEGSELDDELDGELDDLKYVGVVVQHAKRLAIHTINDLESVLNFDPLPFLNKIRIEKGNTWTVSRSFVLFLLLIRSKFEEFSVDYLVNEGWDENIAVRVISGAIADAKA